MKRTYSCWDLVTARTQVMNTQLLQDQNHHFVGNGWQCRLGNRIDSIPNHHQACHKVTLFWTKEVRHGWWVKVLESQHLQSCCRSAGDNSPFAVIQFGTIVEDIPRVVDDVGGSSNVLQVFTAGKCIVSNFDNRVWDSNRNQIGTILNCKQSNRCDWWRNGDGGETGTATECTHSDQCD